jgi:hypothetical protein
MQASGEILPALARTLDVRVPGGRRADVVTFVGRVLDDASGGVLVTVAGVLDQLALGLLESLGLAAAALGHGASGLVGLLFPGRLGADAAADRGRLGRGRFLVFTDRIWSWHPRRLPARLGSKRTSDRQHQ